MKKALYILTILLIASSCKAIMEPIRVQLDGTFWSYSTDDQTARVIFPDDTHVSVLQLDMSTGYTQSLHGTYYTDGHAAICNGEDWSSEVKFVRTFTHLKNSKTNKNLTELSPRSPGSLAGSVWAVLENRNFHLAYFCGDGTCIDGTYKNVNREEGVPYGWTWSRADYTLSGSRVEAGQFKGVLFDKFMVVDTMAVMIATPAPESSGTTALTGTVWEYESSSYPGALIFTSDTTFTRTLVGSKIIHETKEGTYHLDGTSITMSVDGKEETCQIEGGRFTFFSRRYRMVTLP